VGKLQKSSSHSNNTVRRATQKIIDILQGFKEIPSSGIMGDIDGELTQSGSSQSPSAIDACIHELVQKRGLTQPKAPAICAWNGTLTYAELDSRSSSFATYLGNKGVRPEIYVPLCMEKSSWVPVAMLGVLKAGGAFVLLDPSHPIQRMQDVCQAVEANMIITSRENAAKTSKLGLEVILADDNTDAWWKDHKFSKTMGTPDNAAYVMFTSGTTGTPKGAIIEHRSFCTSALAHSRAMGMDSGSRVLQFASYAFDASLIEILTTLIVGGCVCIPSEANRKRDLAGASCQLRVNFALFTPSLARVLEVHDFPMLETLVLGGEAVRADDVQKWAPHVRLFGAYGPTECAALCMVMPYEVGDAGIDASNLGREVGIACWVVDPHDHNRLSPAGTAGELLLDGSVQGQ
jgi:amino acid adenylation domain-containing protein